MSTWNRCDVCGKYIPIKDFGEGALRRLVYPDSELTEETWETLCKKYTKEWEADDAQTS